MDLVTLPIVWMPPVFLCLFLFANHLVGAGKPLFAFLGALFLIFGFLLGGVGMSMRGALVPGDYVGWSNFEILKDQLYIFVLLGGSSVGCGVFLLLSKSRLAK